jgi:hypothetical protein
MTIGWMVVACLMMNQPSAAAEVTVYLAEEGTAWTSAATEIATSTFKKAGVRVVWRGPRDARVPGVWLPIRLVDGTPEGLPTVLAVSFPYARCSKGITVFLDRIRSVAPGITRESAMLAYVLVHEITHVIQGVNRHSPAGVMKARWSDEDRAAIFERRLGFADVDVLLMRRGLATGWCDGAPGLMDPSGPGIALRRE